MNETQGTTTAKDLPLEDTVRQHRYFFIEAAGIKDCIQACKDKGLKFLNAERQDHASTRYGTDKDGKAFARRTMQDEVVHLPSTFTWKVKAMEKGNQ